MHRLLRLLAAGLLLASLTGCGFVVIHGARKAYEVYTADDRKVDTRLGEYRQLVVERKLDQLTAMFEPAGELSQDAQPPLVGRAAIAAFLRSSAGAKVVEYELKPASTSAHGDSASQKGSFRQRLLTPDGQTLMAQGEFEATWSRQGDGTWLLRDLGALRTVRLPAALDWPDLDRSPDVAGVRELPQGRYVALAAPAAPAALRTLAAPAPAAAGVAGAAAPAGATSPYLESANAAVVSLRRAGGELWVGLRGHVPVEATFAGCGAGQSPVIADVAGGSAPQPVAGPTVGGTRSLRFEGNQTGEIHVVCH